MTPEPLVAGELRPAGGPPPILLPYQARWVADDSDVKVAEKGRRIGLTWAEASDDVLIAARAKAEGGDDVLYIGYNVEMTREFIDACAVWARAFAKAASEVDESVFDDIDEHGDSRQIKTFRIDFAGGNSITALSSKPRSLRGRQGVLVIDEAAFHDDLPGLLKAAMAFLIWGGRVRIISTHNGADNAFNELVEDCRKGRKPYTPHRITFDDALADGLYRRICEVLGRDWSPQAEAEWREKIIAVYRPNEDEELFAIPAAGSGVYIPGALVMARMRADIPVLRWECPGDFAEKPARDREAAAADWLVAFVEPHLEALDAARLSSFGMDFGRSGDLSDLWPMQLMPDLSRHTPFLIELRNVPFDQQRQILFHVVDRLPRFTAGALDARGNGQYLAEVAMQRYGSSRIAQVMLSQGWYRENMPRYKAAFEDGMIDLPMDDDVLADHRALVMDGGVAKVPESKRYAGADGKQRHGDSAIAGALSWFASLIDAVPIEFQAVGGPRQGLRAFDDDMAGGFVALAESDTGWGTVGGLNDFAGY